MLQIYKIWKILYGDVNFLFDISFLRVPTRLCVGVFVFNLFLNRVPVCTIVSWHSIPFSHFILASPLLSSFSPHSHFIFIGLHPNIRIVKYVFIECFSTFADIFSGEPPVDWIKVPTALQLRLTRRPAARLHFYWHFPSFLLLRFYLFQSIAIKSSFYTSHSRQKSLQVLKLTRHFIRRTLTLSNASSSVGGTHWAVHRGEKEIEIRPVYSMYD